jgi:chemotaxis protein methyltransferase CheR
MVTDEQFDRTRRLALRLTGINLFERHRELLERRSRRLGMSDAGGFEALLHAAEDRDHGAERQMIGLLTTNFTGFFRHPWHFQFAAKHALRVVHRNGVARLWSAAAATGEEPYSLVMALIDIFQSYNPPVAILATDIHEDALSVARQGEYAEPALSRLDADHRTRFFNQTADTRHWRITQAARDLVEFRVLNLTDSAWPFEGPFDVVFCRNVLMYLEACHRFAVLERMASVLAPDGVLILDPTEHLGKAGHLFAHRADGIYSSRPRSCGQRELVSAAATWTKCWHS